MPYLGTVASATSKTSSTTLTVTTTTSIPAGTVLFMGIASDNSAATAPTISSITNSGGAAWIANGVSYSTGNGTAAGDGTAGFFYYLETLTAIGTGVTLCTITFSAAVVANAVNVIGFSEVDVVARGSFNTGVSTVGTPTATNTSPVIGDTVIGVVIGEDNASAIGDTDTTNGSWSTISSISSTGGNALTNVTVGLQYKKVTATGNQTYNPTTSGDASVIVADFILYVPVSANGTSSSITSSATTIQNHVVPLNGQSNSNGALPSLAAVNTFVLTAQSNSFGSLPAGIRSPTSASGQSNSTSSSARIYATLVPTASGQSNSTSSQAAIRTILAPIMNGQSNSSGSANQGLIVRFTGSGQSNTTGSLAAFRAVGVSGSGLSVSAGSGAAIATLAPTMTGQSNTTGSVNPAFLFRPTITGQSNATGSLKIGLDSKGTSTAVALTYGSATVALTIRSTSSGKSTSSGSTNGTLSASTTFIGWGSPI